MRVFLSWSGARAKAIASILRTHIPRVLQRIEPWMSEKDIAGGLRWQKEIAENLERCDVGICVITPENMGEPWLNFEAGAIAKLKGGQPIPFLVDLSPSDLSGPLSQFQAREGTKDGLGEMLRDLNRLLLENALDEGRLADAVDNHLGVMLKEIEGVSVKPAPKGTEVAVPVRPDGEKLDEILAILRAEQQGSSPQPGGLSAVFPTFTFPPGAIDLRGIDLKSSLPESTSIRVGPGGRIEFGTSARQEGEATKGSPDARPKTPDQSPQTLRKPSAGRKPGSSG